MTLLSKARARQHRRRIHWMMQDGCWAYWRNDWPEVFAILEELFALVIHEPDPNSQEYKDGERKQETPQDESQAEVEFQEDELTPEDEEYVTTIGTERDSEGYLIR